MAYLGTPPKSRVLSSADIATGAITLDDISFTDQSTSVNISGNIDKHTMRLSDEVVIDGDLNITDNLILSKISDDGNAITLTPDGSTRTITGTGSLEASTLTQTPNASLTGMTGTVGSGVTIGSDVTFPTGMMIQITEDAYTAVANRGSTSFGAFTEYSVRSTISNCQSTSKIFISTNVCANGTNDLIAMFALYDVTNSQYVSNMGADGHFGVSIDANGRQRSISFQTLYTPPSYNSGTLIIELYTKGSSTDNVRINQRGQGDAYARGTTNIILQEIAG